MAVSGILFALCALHLSQPCHIASQWICRHVGIAPSRRFLGSLGHCTQLVFCRLLRHGRNVGQCSSITPVLEHCQRNHYRRRSQEILYVSKRNFTTSKLLPYISSHDGFLSFLYLDPLFGLFANVALIFSGQYVRWVSKMRSTLAPGVDAWAVSLQYLMGAVLAGGGVILATYRHMQRNIVPTLEKNTNGSAATAKVAKKKKPKMSMKESAQFLFSSPYIRDLALLVISYGMCINIVEVSWKSKLKQAFPNPNEYSAFMGNFSSATGLVTLIMMLLGRTIFAKFGWRVAALVTPINLGVTGLLFFALNIFSDFFAPLTSKLGTTPLMLAVIVGAAQNILSKSAKYSLFDPCKEMAYIPLDQESKTKGKAAIDVIGNPLGKSGGALIQQFLIFGLGSLSASTPVSDGFTFEDF